MHLPGFSNQVNLGDIGEIKTTSRPVMHIRIWGAQQGLKWRGGALGGFRRQALDESTPLMEPVPVTDGEAELAASADRPGGQAPQLRSRFEEISTRRPVLRRHARERPAAARPEDLPRRGRRLSSWSDAAAGLPLRGVQPARGSARKRAAAVSTRRSCRWRAGSAYLQLPTLDSRIAALARGLDDGPRDRSRAGARRRTPLAQRLRLHARIAEPRSRRPIGVFPVRSRARATASISRRP